MKKTQHIIRTALVWMFAMAAVVMMVFTIISVRTTGQNGRSLFGFKFFIVTSDSMSATDFSSGDLVIVKRVDPEKLEPGQIITFLSRDPRNFGATVTHKIRELTTDDQGNPGFITYGTTNDQNDTTIVTYDYVIGIYKNRIPKLGSLLMFMKTSAGYLTCILLPFSFLLISIGFDCVRLFNQSKKEQEERLRALQKELEREKAENRRIRAESDELRAQLALKASDDATPSSDTSADNI